THSPCHKETTSSLAPKPSVCLHCGRSGTARRSSCPASNARSLPFRSWLLDNPAQLCDCALGRGRRGGTIGEPNRKTKCRLRSLRQKHPLLGPRHRVPNRLHEPV